MAASTGTRRADARLRTVRSSRARLRGASCPRLRLRPGCLPRRRAHDPPPPRRLRPDDLLHAHAHQRCVVDCAGHRIGDRKARRDVPGSDRERHLRPLVLQAVAVPAAAAREGPQARASHRAHRLAAAHSRCASRATGPRADPFRRLAPPQSRARARAAVRLSAIRVLEPLGRHPSDLLRRLRCPRGRLARDEPRRDSAARRSPSSTSSSARSADPQTLPARFYAFASPRVSRAGVSSSHSAKKPPTTSSRWSIDSAQ
jgi:hypothetical protein